MESWINTWLSAAPHYFTFSIKVSRYITDYVGLKGQKAIQLWNKFSKTLDRISDKIDFLALQDVTIIQMHIGKPRSSEKILQ